MTRLRRPIIERPIKLSKLGKVSDFNYVNTTLATCCSAHRSCLICRLLQAGKTTPKYRLLLRSISLLEKSARSINQRGRDRGCITATAWNGGELQVLGRRVFEVYVYGGKPSTGSYLQMVSSSAIYSFNK